MKILVVDDEEGILQGLETYLSLNGYEVVTADTGERALELHERHDVKIVLLDINMPQMSGLEILRQIKARAYNTEVIMITGFNSMDKTIEAREHGADEYLVKPFDEMQQVGTVVEQTHQRVRRWQKAFNDGLRGQQDQRESDNTDLNSN